MMSKRAFSHLSTKLSTYKKYLNLFQPHKSQHLQHLPYLKIKASNPTFSKMLITHITIIHFVDKH
jgi:hypothetical protein